MTILLNRYFNSCKCLVLILTLRKTSYCNATQVVSLYLKFFFLSYTLLLRSCVVDSQDLSLTQLERLKEKSVNEIVNSLLVSLNELATRKIANNSQERRNLNQNAQGSCDSWESKPMPSSHQSCTNLTLVCSPRSYTIDKNCTNWEQYAHFSC